MESHDARTMEPVPTSNEPEMHAAVTFALLAACSVNLLLLCWMA